MSRYELLVHVMAPGTINDDNRYRNIARAVAAFDPATVTQLSQANPDADHENRSQGNDEDFAIPSSFTTANQTPIIVSESPVMRMSSNDCSLHWESTTSSVVIGDADSRHRQWAARHLVHSVPLSDPSYGNSCSKPTIDTKPARSSLVHTPDRQRPRTAPAAVRSHVQVPLTGRKLRKRALSESSSFHDMLNAVSDSQPNTSFTCLDGAKPSYELCKTPSQRQTDCSMLSQTGTDQPYKRRCVDESANGPAEAGGSQILTNVIDLVSPSFVRDRTMDWTTSSAPSLPSTDSLVSTVSPSQTLLPTFYCATAAFPLADTSAMLNSSVDLTSPEKRISAPTVTKHSPGCKDLNSAPQSSHVPPTHSEAVGIMHGSLAETMEINAPPPPTTSQLFVSHISHTLDYIAHRLPLPMYFRPECVRRDVKVLERGYWRIPIVIAPPPQVSEARQTPTKQELLLSRTSELNSYGDAAAERISKWIQTRQKRTTLTGSHAKQDVWTEAELLTFWSNVTAFVRDGKSGWGIRVVRDIVRDHVSSPGRLRCPTTNEVRILMKVFCWGEVLGHLYLALWVLSDKLVEYLPMEWVAGDETTVVRMTGERRRHGSLGPWTRKGPKGEGGSWGVGETPCTMI